MFTLDEAHRALQSSVRRFAQRELRWRARKLDAAPAGSVDWELLRKSCALGLLSGQLPPPYGGTLDRLAAAVALEELARWEAGFATLLAANSLAQTAIALAGNAALGERIFGEIAAAEARQEPLLCALALTERRAGSDLLHPDGLQPTRLMVVARRRNDAYVLSGRKAYCAGGNVAKWLVAFATVHPQRHSAGLTGFAVATEQPGFRVTEVLPTLGLRACPLVEFYFEGAVVPAEQRLTPEGQGYALVQRLGAYDRCQGAAIAVGIADGAFALARQHTLARVQGGGPLVQHQLVRHLLADMAIHIEAARLLTYKAAASEPPEATLSAMAKVLASDVAVKVTTDAVQLMGAYGTTAKAGVEKYFRDAKMTQILSGTNEICRLAVTRPLLPLAAEA
ncbi:MAG: acyl-CoA dehydrogenase [Candidatus Tectimicrobiota bacterium]|nr:MAG: acyl-CoA dehydrogenase [Candidatus Tectomicrobia bacterium]